MTSERTEYMRLRALKKRADARKRRLRSRADLVERLRMEGIDAIDVAAQVGSLVAFVIAGQIYVAHVGSLRAESSS